MCETNIEKQKRKIIACFRILVSAITHLVVRIVRSNYMAVLIFIHASFNNRVYDREIVTCSLVLDKQLHIQHLSRVTKAAKLSRSREEPREGLQGRRYKKAVQSHKQASLFCYFLVRYAIECAFESIYTYIYICTCISNIDCKIRNRESAARFAIDGRILSSLFFFNFVFLPQKQMQRDSDCLLFLFDNPNLLDEAGFLL